MPELTLNYFHSIKHQNKTFNKLANLLKSSKFEQKLNQHENINYNTKRRKRL